MVSQLKSVAVGFLLVGALGAIALTPPAIAMHPDSTHETTADPEPQFRTIEQPLALKAGVTLAGLGLIGLELWWFLFSNKHAGKQRENT